MSMLQDSRISIDLEWGNTSECDCWCIVLLQDSRISIEAMLQSPYVGDIQSEAEEWCNALREIEEITDLWSICQKKVGDGST